MVHSTNTVLYSVSNPNLSQLSSNYKSTTRTTTTTTTPKMNRTSSSASNQSATSSTSTATTASTSSSGSLFSKCKNRKSIPYPWKLDFDDTLQQYYYTNTADGTISYDLPNEVKYKPNTNKGGNKILHKIKSLTKKRKSIDDSKVITSAETRRNSNVVVDDNETENASITSAESVKSIDLDLSNATDTTIQGADEPYLLSNNMYNQYRNFAGTSSITPYDSVSIQSELASLESDHEFDEEYEDYDEYDYYYGDNIAANEIKPYTRKNVLNPEYGLVYTNYFMNTWDDNNDNSGNNGNNQYNQFNQYNQYNQYNEMSDLDKENERRELRLQMLRELY